MEDDPDIASAVKEYLEQKGFRVTVGSTLAQARQMLEAQVPACVLLDWNMPDGRGDRLCQWIRSRWRELPVIFLTVRGDSEDIVSGFQSGADDYVVKPFALEVLHSRIQALLRRAGSGEQRYLSCDGIHMDRNRRMVFCDLVQVKSGSASAPECGREEIPLSAAEYELLLYLMQNKGRTVTREKILEQVWDVNGSYVNDNTLTVTLKRLRAVDKPPNFVNVTRYHDKNPAKIAEIFQRKRSWFSMPWPLSSF